MQRHSFIARLLLAGVLTVLAPACADEEPVPDHEPRRGQVVVHPDNPRWFAYHGKGPVFMAGPGDPEGFLYRGERRPDGTRDGDQVELIRKLASSGANSIYLMAVRSHGGDGDATQNPFVDGDPRKGINRRVLRQWKRWFRKMDRKGIIIFFIFYDDSARIWDTGDRVGPEERKFVHTLVDAFEKRKRLIWVVAEEYQERYSAERISAIAGEIRKADDHGHPIAVHKLNGLRFDEFADDPHLDQFAMQFHGPTPRDLYEGVRVAWRDADGRYNLNLAEGLDWGSGGEARRKVWAAAMAGAYVMVYEMDIESTPRSDLVDCGRLVRFMESTDFHLMEPREDLARESTLYALANPGSSYILYAAAAKGPLGVDGLAEGRYRLRWLDIPSGDEVVEERQLAAGATSLPRPSGVGGEVALYLQRLGG